MTRHLPLKSTLLAALFAVTSCATTKYSDDVNRNNYSNLETGRTYSFKLRDSKLSQKMIFSNIKNDSIIGTTGKDNHRISLAKSNITQVTDTKKNAVTVGAAAIGAAAAAALIISSTRADK